MKRKLTTMIYLGTVILILASSPGFAAGVSISLSPIRVEHSMKQGEKGTDAISVTNDGTASTRLKVTVADWTLTRDGNPMFTKPGGDPYSCAGWIRMNPVDFRIAPGQTREVRYTITVPEAIDDGGYRAAVIFETIPDSHPEEERNRIFLKGRIIAILYEVVGKPVPDGYAKSLRTEWKKEGIDFVLELQNVGKVHYRTKGSIAVKDSSGNRAFEIELPDLPVLPGSEREIKITYDKVIPRGTYSAIAVVDIGKKELIGAETTFSVD